MPACFDALDHVLEAVSRLPLQVLLASAGRFRRARLPANVHIAEFLPGDVAARRAALVICNGGKPDARARFAACLDEATGAAPPRERAADAEVG